MLLHWGNHITYDIYPLWQLKFPNGNPVDGSGERDNNISMEELAYVLLQFGLPIKDVKQIMRQVDHNGDSQMSFDEFQAIEKKMETTIVYWGYLRIMDKKMEATIAYWGYIGIMEKKMETTIVYWGYIGIMEMKMETPIVP